MIEEQPVKGSQENTEQPFNGSEKFKDDEALKRAYEALEAEFTRKSQQLATLKRENEKLLARDDQAKTVEDFLQSYPKAADMRAELLERAEGVSPEALKAAYLDILNEKYSSREGLLQDEQFLDNCAENEILQEKIIRAYLEAVQSGNSPRTLSGGYMPVRKRSRARSIEDAGEMTKGLYK